MADVKSLVCSLSQREACRGGHGVASLLITSLSSCEEVVSCL